MRRTPILCAVGLALVSACTAGVPAPSGGAGESGALVQAGASSTGGPLTSGGTTAAGAGTASGGAATGRAGTGGTTTGAAGNTSSGGATGGGTTTGGGVTTTGGNTASAGAGPSSGGGGEGGSTNGGNTSLGGSGGMSAAGEGAGGSAGGAGASPAPGCAPPTEYPNLFVTLLGETQADVDAKVQAAWNQLYNPSDGNTVFYNGPGGDESYVKDVANNDVRTEGMSYGMMTAVQLDHQMEFDRLWAFVKNHMAQSNGQFTWHTSTSGSSLGGGSAPDGDEYFATALIFANKRWGASSGQYDYAVEAQAVLDSMREQMFDDMWKIVEFTPGSGNTDGSYVLPAFYQTWACFDTVNEAFWTEAVTAGRAFFQAAADGNGVIPDRSAFNGQSQGSAGSDAVRCVMNVMMDHNFFNADPWQETYASTYGSYIRTHSNNTTAMLACNGLLGFGLPEETGTPFVQALWDARIPSGQYRYYDGTLYMLALLHVSGTFKLWY